MNWTCILAGRYYTATGIHTGDEYVIRTRPKGDGWMAINDYERIVLATGLSMADAKEVCESYDKHAAESFTRDHS